MPVRDFAHAVALALAFAGAEDEIEIPIHSAIVIEGVGGGSRSPVFLDPVESERVRGGFHAPKAGDEVKLPDGSRRSWKNAAAREDGAIPLRGGYAFATVESAEERVLLLDARGHRHVFVNGEPRAGDVYDLGFVRVPVRLKKGRNEFLFKGGRGRVLARLVPPPAEVTIDERNVLLPDLLAGENGPFVAGLTLLNSSAEWRRGLFVSASAGGTLRETALPPLPPLSVRRVAVEIVAPEGASSETPARFVVREASGREIHALERGIAVKKPSEPHRRTFLSEIDGSVQYFAVVPATGGAEGEKKALVLTLHGAGVEASGQAACYPPREGVTIVAPTNRRPYGFDWEDWGRLDALEVLGRAERLFGTDPRRTYLTGHSMGGHGTWVLGVQFPGRFAAIAPSAAWSDFWAYTGAEAIPDSDPVGAILSRAANASRTRLLDENLEGLGVYVLHGDGDETVPVGLARAMRQRLSEFHSNFAYFERKGAGHWWGNECVDWPPLLEFLRRNALPEAKDATSVAFSTVNPGLSASRGFVMIETQERSLEKSRAEAKVDAEKRRVEAKTENVAAIAFDLAAFPGEGPFEIVIDGETVAGGAGVVRLARAAGSAWGLASERNPERKGPHRAGPFKDAFRNRMVLVYGTRGTDDDNAWAFAKARYDAEQFFYRGNGGCEIVPDSQFHPAAEPDRNVILYGNADTNGAWRAVLGDSPIDVRRGKLSVGEKTLEASDLACLFVRPRAGSAVASAGVVSGTGLFGMRLTEQVPYFVSGVAYPDWVVIGAEMLEKGHAGVRAAGFFGADWTLDPAQSGWR